MDLKIKHFCGIFFKFFAIILAGICIFVLLLFMLDKKSIYDIYQSGQNEDKKIELNSQKIKNFRERKFLNKILEFRDRKDLIRYVYIVTFSGSIKFLGNCLGYGVPFSARQVNPMREIKKDTPLGTVPRIDQNGLFMPKGHNAVWLMMIDLKTEKKEPMYISGAVPILISPFAL